MRSTLFAALFLLAFAVAGQSPVRAQTMPGDPAPAGTLSSEAVDLASVNFDDSFTMIENPFLSDMIKLDYQIGLLTKMVERQSMAEKISESYENLGIAYTPPPPSIGLCRQLPANALCLKAYPDLYTGVVQARKSYHEAQTEGPASDESAAEEAARLAREDEIRREQQEREERRTRYRWTDISCIDGACRAVLVAPGIPGYRATVHAGQTVAENVSVATVSAAGVVLKIDGDIVTIRPAAGDFNEGPASPAAAPDITSAPAPVASAPVAAAPAPARTALTAPVRGAIANTAISNPNTDGQAAAEPALGPSGLF